jgi:hypothetical protein
MTEPWKNDVTTATDAETAEVLRQARLISLAPEMAELLERISRSGMLSKTSVLDDAVSYAELADLLARARGEDA